MTQLTASLSCQSFDCNSRPISTSNVWHIIIEYTVIQATVKLQSGSFDFSFKSFYSDIDGLIENVKKLSLWMLFESAPSSHGVDLTPPDRH